MAKTKISEFSATPANNTDIDSINISEGCSPSGINDAIRELMAQLKDFQTGAVGDSFNGPVGTTTASTGAFTTLSASSTVSGTGFSTYLASPPAIGGTAAAAGSFTTLSASGNVTLSGGTANGVAYLNGSKVVTSGSALTFDGTTLGATTAVNVGSGTSQTYLAGKILQFYNTGAGGDGTIKASDDTSSVVAIGVNKTEVKFYSSGSEQMRLTSTGLGIGTSSPTYKLQIKGSGAQGAVVTSTSGSASVILENFTGSGNYAYIQYNGHSGSGLQFYDTANVAARMTLDSSGNLGLGVTPSAWGSSYTAFQLPNGGAFWSAKTSTPTVITSANTYFDGSAYRYLANSGATLAIQSTGTHQWYNAPSGTAGNAITFSQVMTLDASGQLGIGTTSPTARLELSGSSSQNLIVNSTGSSSYMQFANSGGITGYIGSSGAINSGGGNNALGFRSQNEMVFATGGSTERARIDSSGNLLVGTTSAGDSKVVFSFPGTVVGLTLQDSVDNSSAYFQAFRNSGGTIIGSVNRVTTTNAVVYNTTSDYRLKTVTGAVTGQGARIDALKPVDYLWKEGNQQARGFLAHEFQAVYPNSVSGDKDAVDADGNPIYQAMQASTSEVIADLVAEIQSLRKRLADAGI